MDETSTTKPDRELTIEERIILVESMVTRGWRVGRMKESLRGRFGIKKSQAMVYIKCARENIMKEYERTPAEHTAESLAFYQDMQGEEDAPPVVRVHARKRVDELLGLDAPKRIHIGGDTGDDAAPLIMQIVPALPPAKKVIPVKNGRRRKKIEAQPATSGDSTGASEAD